MLDKYGYKHILGIYNTYCYSTATVVTRTRLNVTLYVHCFYYTRVGTLIVATIYLQLIQNRYMFRSFTVLQCFLR